MAGLSAALVRYDLHRVERWTLQCEEPCIYNIFARAFNRAEYPRERGIFDIALSGSPPTKVPPSAFAGVERGKWQLRQAVLLFNAREAAAWTPHKDQFDLFHAVQGALVAAANSRAPYLITLANDADDEAFVAEMNELERRAVAQGL